MAEKIILLGNGVNRLGGKDSWRELLIRDSGGKIVDPENLIPEPILFDQYTIPSGKPLADEIPETMLAMTPNDWHEKIVNLPIQHILTTNYDYCLETSLLGVIAHEIKKETREIKYSRFRRKSLDSKTFWHIHGEANYPNSIMMGYDHYAGYLGEIRNICVNSKEEDAGNSGIEPGKVIKEEGKGSWVELFLQSDVDILGLGMYFSEIDLWWVLIHKFKLMRMGMDVGQTTFYHYHDKPLSALEERILETLRNFGAKVVDKEVENFSAGYDNYLAGFAGSNLYENT